MEREKGREKGVKKEGGKKERDQLLYLYFLYM